MWLLQSELCAATVNPTAPSTRANSSTTATYSTYPSPAPPYSSGKITPSSPISASFGRISSGKCDASSHSITCGAISPSANSRTLFRKCFCSSLNVKSTPASPHHSSNTSQKFILYCESVHPCASPRIVIPTGGRVPQVRCLNLGLGLLLLFLAPPMSNRGGCRVPQVRCLNLGLGLLLLFLAPPMSNRGGCPILRLPPAKGGLLRSEAKHPLLSSIFYFLFPSSPHHPTAYPFFLFCSSSQIFSGAK